MMSGGPNPPDNQARGWWARLLDSSDVAVAEAAAQLEQARVDNCAVRDELLAANQRGEGLVLELRQARDRLARALHDVQAHEHSRTEHAALVARWNGERAHLGQRLAAAEQGLQKQIQAREAAQAEAHAAREAHAIDRAAIETMAETQRANERVATDKIRKLQQEKLALEGRSRSLQAQQRALGEELDGLRPARSQLDSVTERLATMTERAAQATRERDESRAAQQRLRTTAAEAIAEQERTRAQASAAKADLATVGATEGQLRAQLADAKASTTEAKKALALAVTREQESAKAMAELRSARDTDRAAVREARKAMEQANKQAEQATAAQRRSVAAQQHARQSADTASQQTKAQLQDRLDAMLTSGVALDALVRCLGPRADLALGLELEAKGEQTDDVALACRRVAAMNRDEGNPPMSAAALSALSRVAARDGR